MSLGNFPKKPAEKESYSVDYADDLSSGEQLTATRASVSPAGMVIEFAIVVGKRVKVMCSGGSNGIVYKVTVITNTSSDRILQDDFNVQVKE